jgi:hypothetical protein
VARLPGEALLPILFDFVVFVLVPRGATLTGFGPLVAGARAPRPHKYGTFDRMSAELHHLREQRDAFDVLAEALGTPDG